MSRVTRISYNSKGWQRPTGEARQDEGAETYNGQNGFGHEDWLFRAEWVIDGWRYAFLQGVNKSYRVLCEEKKPFDVTLFTREPSGKRRYVSTIREVECVGPELAAAVATEFKVRGWYQTMMSEIDQAGGNVAALGDGGWTPEIINIRYRQENVRMFPPGEYAGQNDPILNLNRYILTDAANVVVKRTREGRADNPDFKPYWRTGFEGRECTPEHAQMQAALMEQLRNEYPDATIVREQNFVDVTVRTATELILFEIKSDLDPLSVIRHALGQILEYAFHPSRTHEPTPKLVIVGRVALRPDDRIYLDRRGDGPFDRLSCRRTTGRVRLTVRGRECRLSRSHRDGCLVDPRRKSRGARAVFPGRGEKDQPASAVSPVAYWLSLL
jgi:hypothetical protein